MEVLFNNETQEQIENSTYDLIEKAISTSLEVLKISEPVEVSVTITDNTQIRQLNNEYRRIDSATDVLSFPMIDTGYLLTNEDIKEQYTNGHSVPIGDIVISFEKAKEQANDYEHSLDREIAFLTVHSMLHLFGFDHMTDEEEKEMFSQQEIVLNIMGLSREESHV